MPLKAEKSNARISGTMAEKARIAVLFRRGPNKWTEMILWHTDTDQFTRGQWVKHPIHGGSLSPDGELLAYSGSDFRTRQKHKQWVAVSRPPYFTALALWPTRWPGGHGIFTAARRLELFGFINDRKKDGTRMPLNVLVHSPIIPESPSPLGPPDWHRIYPKSRKWTLCWKFAPRRKIFERSLDKPFLISYAVECGPSHWPLHSVDWASCDQRSRLVFTREGKLFAAEVTGAGIREKELADFNRDTPEPSPPPAIAHRWP